MSIGSCPHIIRFPFTLRRTTGTAVDPGKDQYIETDKLV